jgi:uroporphyrinogen-III synthase
MAKLVDIVTFGSPSTVKVWKDRIGSDHPAVVIGKTTYKSAIENGFKEVYYPETESPSTEVWARLVREVAERKKEAKEKHE